MQIQENCPLGPKTTMRIGGSARYFSDVATRGELAQAWALAQEKQLPLIVLGAGSNTIFADGEIAAFVVRIKASRMQQSGTTVTAEAGCYLASLVSELATYGLDLSALTGIPGTLGGAVAGNVGQGIHGVWIDRFITSVTVFDEGKWKTLSREACRFGYRDSRWKQASSAPIIWEVVMSIPERDPTMIQEDVKNLLARRIETQPHLKTAGSCFASLPDGTPAWKLIDAAGLRGMTIGGVQIAEKHANFLLNIGSATYADAVAIVKAVREKVGVPLDVEMRCIEPDGTLAF